MSLYVVGINHTTAPVEIRERVVFPEQELPQALKSLMELEYLDGAAILSTCNRTELYCTGELADNSPVIEWLHDYHGLGARGLGNSIYQHQDAGAVRHLMRVACGLDSMVLGEPQVLGQVKNAWAIARDHKTLGFLLDRLFQHTFAIAKQVRTDTEIGASPVSVAFAAVSLAKQIFSDLSQQSVLLIGAGETIELVARHLADQHIGRMIVANRNLDHAQELAAQFNAYAIDLRQIPLHLAEADIVIASTASTTPILLRDDVELAMCGRKHQPIFLVDIAVPRDIEASIADMNDIYLYTVDDLKDIIDENLRTRQAAADQAEEIIEVNVSHFIGWLSSRNAVPTIRAMRERAEQTQADVLKRAERLLQQGKDPAEVMRFIAHTLSNKLLHAPCTRLREAGFNQQEEVIHAARLLFELNEDSEDKDQSTEERTSKTAP